MPWLLPFLVTGFIFRFLFQLEAGAVNQVLLDVHLIKAPIGYLLSPGWAYVIVLITNIWLGVPFFTVLLYSALQDVPPELKEAAMIDGAGPWQCLVRVTLPVIRPVIEVTFVLGFVFTVKVFDIVISLTQGGPANSTQLIATWAYNLSFQQFDYGAGARSRTTEYGANYPKVSQAIWTAIQSAITGTSSVSSALQTAQGTVSGVQLVSGG